MALTAAQEAKVRLYLGHPDGYRFRNTRLESILGNLSPEAEEQIIECLAGLAAVEAAVLTGQSSPIEMAGIKRVDEIWFNTGSPSSGHSGFKNLKEAGKYFAGRISIITGVPIASNAFGSGGYEGDAFMPGSGSSRGVFPFG